MTPAKHAELARLLTTGLDAPSASRPWGIATLDEAFGRVAPRLLDVGTGTGEATLAWAAAHSDRDVVAVEVHQPGLLALLRALRADGPGNVRVVEADVTELIEHTAGEAFVQVRVLFPDPWPKRRHVGRRLVDPAFLRRATDLVGVGGTVHLATDSDDYAAQMRSCVAGEHRLQLVLDEQITSVDRSGDRSAPASTRPVTTYEQRGLDAGRTVTDLVARRVR